MDCLAWIAKTLWIKGLCCGLPSTLSIPHLILELAKKKKFQMLVSFENCKSCAPVMTEVGLIGHTVLLSFQAASGLYLSSCNAVFALRSAEKVNNLLGISSVNANKGCRTLGQGQSRTVVASSWIGSGCCKMATWWRCSMTVSVKLQLKYLVILQTLAARGGEDKQAKQLS